MSLDYQNDGSFHEKLIEEVLSAYPDKFAKRRRKHLSVAKPAKDAAEVAEGGGTVTECEVKSNIKSIPGVMTVRGCVLAAGEADIMLSGGRTQFIALKARVPWLDMQSGALPRLCRL